MRMAREAKHKLALIDGSIPKPNVASPNLHQWTQCNSMILLWLVNALATDIGHSVLYASTARDSSSRSISDNSGQSLIFSFLTALPNLTVLSLSSNYFSGGVPSGFEGLEVLDLLSNQINGSLPAYFGGDKLRYLNLSYNRLSRAIPTDFAKKIPTIATLDLTCNNLTGEVPESRTYNDQKTESFAGNPDLCGKLLNKPCSIPSSSVSTPPNVTDATWQLQ
ncbi:receptor protein kinase-like protein At4g34220 [Telopea speciosissima]|uniref:receptor protein kinase-like protein At4g34220 n=1 Tax=Telopea speciosissima TaxID=54955 RepID=UPI001CC66D97|nr:receptor protein kinase-like protein At4g34220 [Telopea speciosissima]